MAADGSINRTLRVLVALCEHGPQSLAEVSERIGLSPPTTLRFLRIMRDEGFASQDLNRQWRPTLLTWRLGCAVVDGNGWRNALDEALRQASDALRETVVYAAYEQGWSVYVAMAEPRRDMRTHVTLGSRYHADDTITGRCMLAFQPAEEIDRVMGEHWAERWSGDERQQFLALLADVREHRFAVGEGGVWQGLWGAAVPVEGRGGEVVGSVGTAIPSGRQPEQPDAVVRVLQVAAASLSAGSPR